MGMDNPVLPVVLEWRQIRTIALGALAFALFGATVFVVSVRADFSRDMAGDIAAGMAILIGGAWLLGFTSFLIIAYSTAREVATVKAGYGIVTTFENGVLRYELKLATHKLAADLLEECTLFLKNTFKVREPSISADRKVLTANVAAFAFDIYPHPVHIVVGPQTDKVCSVRVATETRLILGLPAVDTHGVAILALFAQWIRGTPLPTSGFPRLMWKTVVSSAKSCGAAVATPDCAPGRGKTPRT